jgi:hypothetical protein
MNPESKLIFGGVSFAVLGREPGGDARQFWLILDKVPIIPPKAREHVATLISGRNREPVRLAVLPPDSCRVLVGVIY